MSDTPSPRITEAELLEHEGAPMCPCGIAPSLVAEIRRYRAMLIGLGECVLGPDAWCNGCQRSFISEDAKHGEGCPVGELEAEVQAIRAERVTTGHKGGRERP